MKVAEVDTRGVQRESVGDEEARLKVPLHPRPAWAEGMDNTSGQAVKVDLREDTFRSSSDEHDCSMYRLTLHVESPTAVAVRYFFPPGNAANNNAWLGLFRRESMTWKEEYGEVESGSSKVRSIVW